MSTTEKTKSLYRQLYDGITDSIKKAQLPKKERLSKMKAITAHDSAETKVDEYEIKIQEEFKKVSKDEEIDWNKIVEYEDRQNAARSAMATLEKRYKEVFGAKLAKNV